ncbi:MULTISPECIES: hypothetical protein [unclassified Nonomuraea]|nr:MULTISPECIES: hypothetical protein [unclassified Nonomuraea]
MGNIGIAVAGLRDHALSLAEALAGRGVHVGHVAVVVAAAS